MSKEETASGICLQSLNIEFMRSLVKQYSELGQWTSALFWADAAAGAGAVASGAASGDDIWLLASTMLARGEFHRASYAVTSRGLHRQHLLCLGVAMRAHVMAREAAAALALLDECDPMLLEPRSNDQTHNRALAGMRVWYARALCLLERRGAAAAALQAALRADAACVEALDLLLEQHALTPAQETELVESLPITQQLGSAEGALVKAAYMERLRRYQPADDVKIDTDDCALTAEVEAARAHTSEAALCRARRLAASCQWAEALKILEGVDAWCLAEVRAACLVELRSAAPLFALAHALVDAYPHTWQAWYAVGCYYYLAGKSEFARRYLSKAKSIDSGAGCLWLAYGHSFAADTEHDQAMAAYFKASQLMSGCYVPALYVAVECALLNNLVMCERFMYRAALLYNGQGVESSDVEGSGSGGGGGEAAGSGGGLWERVAVRVRSPHVAHEAACAALADGQHAHAHALALKAIKYAAPTVDQLTSRWAPTLDVMGHICRHLGQPAEALEWHEKALALRPGRASTYAAMGLCLALLGREPEAADKLHSALAKDPNDVVSLALLDAIVDRLDAALTEEEIPQFPFPSVCISTQVGAEPEGVGDGDSPRNLETTYDKYDMSMSMSFD